MANASVHGPRAYNTAAEVRAVAAAAAAEGKLFARKCAPRQLWDRTHPLTLSAAPVLPLARTT
eukprot:668917-Prymnesium_polylepis.2